MQYMLDTNICIFILRNQITSALQKKLLSIPLSSICLSVITVAELELGVKKSSNPTIAEVKLQHFFAPLEIIPFDINDTLVYAEVRAKLESQGLTIDPLDTFIASHALSKQLTLVTNNTKEFSRVKGLAIQDWTVK